MCSNYDQLEINLSQAKQIEKLRAELSNERAKKAWYRGFCESLAQQFPEPQKSRLLETLEKEKKESCYKESEPQSENSESD